MNLARDVLELECQLRLIEHMEATNPTGEPLDLWIDGFWAGVRAGAKPRSAETLEAAIELRRARAGITKQETPCVPPTT